MICWRKAAGCSPGVHQIRTWVTESRRALLKVQMESWGSDPPSELGENTKLGDVHCNVGWCQSLQSLHTLYHKRLGGLVVCGMACTLKYIHVFPSKASALYGTEINRFPNLQRKSGYTTPALGQESISVGGKILAGSVLCTQPQHCMGSSAVPGRS